MLNRLFVVIGVFVILALSAAFLLPRLIYWGDYRPRLEAMASSALGAPVSIDGDIRMTLLPQPQLQLTKIRVGPAASPSIEIETVEAEFSLLDFFRDTYNVTKLEIDHPTITVGVAPDGSVQSGLALAESAGQSNVSVANAELTNGTFRVNDARSGQTLVASAIAGQLKLDAARGPFSFQGQASYNDASYAVRITTGSLDSKGATTLSTYIKPADSSFTMETSGALQTGSAPKFSGDLTLRVPPPRPATTEVADAGRGDFVLTGKLEAVPERILLSNYTAIPDENRSATRLTGAGEIKLGSTATFNAVISGGVVALPPRDATKELTDPPYELVRLLAETRLPPIPPIAGTIGLDVNEINLRAVSLRNLRVDAATDGKGWTVRSLEASLQGGAKVGLTGTLDAAGGKPVFAGRFTLDADRLDLLAALWRKPPPDSPLFGMPGSLSANVALSGDTLDLSNGTLVLDGINQAFDAEIGFGAQRRLKLDAHLTTLGATESAALLALMPDMTGNGSFGATFPRGELDLSASKAVLFGLDGSDLAARASWDGGVLEFSEIRAGDLGGMSFEGKLTAFGTVLKPEFSGSGTLRVIDNAPAFNQLMTALGAPKSLATFVGLSLPANLNLELDAPTGQGAQAFRADGKLGTAETKISAQFASGLATALTAPMTVDVDMSSTSPHMMERQLALGDLALFDDRTPLRLKATIDGVPSNSYETQVTLESGSDHMSFAGNVVPGDFSKLTGQGDIDLALADPSALANVVGAGGLYLPAVAGTAKLQFTGLDNIRLTDIAAGAVTGSLTLHTQDQARSATGSLKVAAVDIDTLLPLLVGAPGTLKSPDSIWPDGPIDIGATARQGEGRIDVEASSLTVHGRPFGSDVRFGFDWTPQNVQVRDLSAAVGGGSVGLDIVVCCAGTAFPAKQISGRITLKDVAADRILPPALVASLSGTISASAAFEASGASVREAVGNATGTGSYTVADLSVAHFDPAAFTMLAGLSGIADMDPVALGTSATDALSSGPFAVPSMTGSFTINGGVLRNPNVAMTSASTRVFGGVSVDLRTFSLDGRYAMSPTVPDDPTSAIDPATAEATALIGGSLWAPVGTYDVASLVDGMKIRANEVELARLEQLKAEADARRKAAADEEARRASELAASSSSEDAAAAAASSSSAEAAAQQQASEAAASAAADAAKASEEAARQRASKAAASSDIGL